MTLDRKVIPYYLITVTQEISRLTSKYQATIPLAVRKRLDLRQGDDVKFILRGDEVVLAKASPLDRTYLRAVEQTLEEWSSPEDEHAFRDL